MPNSDFFRAIGLPKEMASELDADARTTEAEAALHSDAVKVSGTDTTAGFLFDKVTSNDASVTLTRVDPGGNETLDLSVQNPTPGGSAGGDLGGSYPDPTVTQTRGVRTTTGPTNLVVGAVADGTFLKRVGTTLVGAVPVAASDGKVKLDSGDLPEFMRDKLGTNVNAMQLIDGNDGSGHSRLSISWRDWVSNQAFSDGANLHNGVNNLAEIFVDGSMSFTCDGASGGERLMIVCVAAINTPSAVVTITGHGFSSITFNAEGQSVMLVQTGFSKFAIVGSWGNPVVA